MDAWKKEAVAKHIHAELDPMSMIDVQVASHSMEIGESEELRTPPLSGEHAEACTALDRRPKIK